MHKSVELEVVIRGTLQALAEAGFKESTLRNYTIVYARLKKRAQQLQVNTLTPELEAAFIQDVANIKTGGYCHTRACFHAIATRYLKEIMEKGSIDWNYTLPKGIGTPTTPVYQLLQERFMLYLTRKGLKANTRDSYRNIVCKFLRFCESCDLHNISDIHREIIPVFFEYLGETWNIGSYRTAAAGLRCFLTSDAELIHLAKAVPKHLPRKVEIIPVLTDSQQQVLWNALLHQQPTSARNTAIVALLLTTGLRAADISNLKFENIDWQRDTIHIIQCKTEKPLILPLLPAVGNILMEYILNERPKSSHDKIFLKSFAPYTPLRTHTACRAIVETVFKSAGVEPEAGEIGSRLLRHNAASKLLASGSSTQIISSMLGHSDNLTADVYLTTEREPMLKCVLPMPACGEGKGRCQA